MNNGPRIVPVILSGGAGTRLWPASRPGHPKQLLPLVGDRSMIRATAERVAAVGSTAAPIIVTNAAQAEAIDSELGLSGWEHPVLILEPVGRNTAPAVAAAAHEIVSAEGDGLMLVLPSDHTISDTAAFAEAVTHAATLAAKGWLVTFGITPSDPETGYGYIKVGETIDDDAMRVAEFSEKPDEVTAERYLAEGSYLWNSGMFLFQASRYLEELELHAPDIAASAAAAYAAATRDGSHITLDPDSFAACRADSIDYAVMETTSTAAVIPIDPGWNDVGSWASLWDIGKKDADRNVTIGDVELDGVTGSYIRADGRLIAVIGVDDIVVVDTPDALLIVNRDRAQDVKEIVDRLADSKRPEVD